ncbi:nitrate- and nitrite sensing domain-containing protein [Actinoplanes sp. NPDC051851]|uniref:sensor histidine kinase n=1 Tax=Actinoplanes sp. NPDC051851 TaxID=3154753 RepID=UPI003431C49E
MLALPLAAMLVLLAVIYADEVAGYRTAAATERRVTVILAVQSLVQDLQQERGITGAVLGGNATLGAEVDAARRRVDSRRTQVRSELGGGDDLAGQAAEAVGELESGLAAVRARADARSEGRDAVFNDYSDLIEQVSENYRHLEIVDDDSLRLGAESLEMLTEVKEATAQEWVFLDGVFAAGRFRDGEFARFLAIIASRDLSLGEFDEFASPESAAAKSQLLGSEAALRASALEKAALQNRVGNVQQWWDSVTTMLDDMTVLAEKIAAGTQERAVELRDRATMRLLGLSGVVLLCLAGSAYLAIAATRAIAEPLTGLAEAADRLAGERLPEAVRRVVAGEDAGPPGPVPVEPGASTEVRQVAGAFSRVQSTAYALAAEQVKLRRASAESLANLGRRNQNLLRRQLGFITSLEREETTPAGLANLFELDHLATRMRRNAESLLVLVGAASPRQWTTPIPLTDVIRAAVSEVEEYRRVVLRRIDEATVQGSAGTGLAHLLAELIENGLAFSPPDMEVEVHGRRVGDGYLIAVCDQGIGMNDAELARANERLRGEGDFMTVPARFLGHYVVGRLAAEMGIDVRLNHSAVTGVTARITLPAAVLAVQEAIAPQPLAVEVDYIVLPEIPGKKSEIPRPRPPAPVLSLVESATRTEQQSRRTANGLRKRIPRAARPTPGTPRAGREAAGEPEAVRSRLTALRDGIRRGENRS